MIESILLLSIKRLINMVISSLTESEAKDLYEMPKKIIKATNRWIPRSLENPNAFYIEIDVITEDETELIVRAWRGVKGKRRYSFALLHKDKTPIRRWDDKIGDPHPFTEAFTSGPHKHFWSDEHQDRPWYPVTDIRVNDPDGAIIDFLKECNVETKGFHIQQNIGRGASV